MFSLPADDDGTPEQWQTPEGNRAYADYVSRMWRWAIAPVPADPATITVENYARAIGATA